MTRTRLVQAIVWLDQVAATAKAEAAKLRADLTADAKAEYDEQGTAPTWRIPDVATVAASVTHEAVHVGDEATFTAWVQARYPTEVETVQRVRPAWLVQFLARAGINGDGAVDTGTGEVVPGLAVRPGGQFGGISVRPTPAAKEVFSALATRGLHQLAAAHSAVVVLAELEAGDAS